MPGRRAAPTATTNTLLRRMQEQLDRIEVALESLVQRRQRSRMSLGGRPPKDDADAVDRVRTLMRQGIDEWAAVKSVAIDLGGNVKANRRRIKNKLLKCP